VLEADHNHRPRNAGLWPGASRLRRKFGPTPAKSNHKQTESAEAENLVAVL